MSQDLDTRRLIMWMVSRYLQSAHGSLLVFLFLSKRENTRRDVSQSVSFFLFTKREERDGETQASNTRHYFDAWLAHHHEGLTKGSPEYRTWGEPLLTSP